MSSNDYDFFHTSGVGSESQSHSPSNRQQQTVSQSFSDFSDPQQHIESQTSSPEHSSRRSFESEQPHQEQDAKTAPSEDRFLSIEAVNDELTYLSVTEDERNDMLEWIQKFHRFVQHYDSRTDGSIEVSDRDLLNYISAFNATFCDLWGYPCVQDLANPPEAVRRIFLNQHGPAIKQTFQYLLDERDKALAEAAPTQSAPRSLAQEATIITQQIHIENKPRRTAQSVPEAITTEDKSKSTRSSTSAGANRSRNAFQPIVQPSHEHRCNDPGCKQCTKAAQKLEYKRTHLHETSKRKHVGKMGKRHKK